MRKEILAILKLKKLNFTAIKLLALKRRRC